MPKHSLQEARRTGPGIVPPLIPAMGLETRGQFGLDKRVPGQPGLHVKSHLNLERMRRKRRKREKKEEEAEQRNPRNSSLGTGRQNQRERLQAREMDGSMATQAAEGPR